MRGITRTVEDDNELFISFIALVFVRPRALLVCSVLLARIVSDYHYVAIRISVGTSTDILYNTHAHTHEAEQKNGKSYGYCRNAPVLFSKQCLLKSVVKNDGPCCNS